MQLQTKTHTDAVILKQQKFEVESNSLQLFPCLET